MSSPHHFTLIELELWEKVLVVMRPSDWYPNVMSSVSW